jgi:multidrug efflux pump subunit AcrA (membrane-fusion protein)
MKKIVFVAALALALTHPLLSAEESRDLSAIVQEQRAIAARIETSDSSLNLTSERIGTIRKAQADVFAVSENKRLLSDLSAADQIRLKNALEKINAALQDTRIAQESRDTCWREKKMGSNISITRCATQKEIAEIREGARAWKEKPPICEGGLACP